MTIRKVPIQALILALASATAAADGGFVSAGAEAVSADQRAIIVAYGGEVHLTLSTAYTGEGSDFGWIIPTPVPPDPADVRETGESGETAFALLDAETAPQFWMSDGCFAEGTPVHTPDGPEPMTPTLLPLFWATSLRLRRRYSLACSIANRLRCRTATASSMPQRRQDCSQGWWQIREQTEAMGFGAVITSKASV